MVPLLLLHAANGEVHSLHHVGGGQAPQQEVHRGVLTVRARALVENVSTVQPLDFAQIFNSPSLEEE